MTKWKEQIDGELGTEQKFTPTLQAKIEANVRRKHRVNWQYGFVLLGMTVALLLFFLTGPSQSIKWEKATSLEQSDVSVKAFYISTLSTEEKFTARDGWYVGIKRYASIQDQQFMQRILSGAEPGDSDILSYYYVQDVLVKLTSGEQLALRFYNTSSSVGFKNVKTGEFYVLADKDIGTYIANYTPELRAWPFIVASWVVLLLNWLAERWLKERYHIRGRSIYYANKKHYWVMMVANLFFVIGIMFFFQGFMIHKGLLLLVIIGMFACDLAFVQKYEELEVVRKFSRIRTAIMIIGVAIGLSYV